MIKIIAGALIAAAFAAAVIAVAVAAVLDVTARAGEHDAVPTTPPDEPARLP